MVSIEYFCSSHKNIVLLPNFLSQTNVITKNTIDKVYDLMRVEEVIGDFVQLKRAGSNYKGLSPFSNER
ncbi:CHC2 zinc finger domain-containing protein, partial [Capnocytophaga leadbetteri]